MKSKFKIVGVIVLFSQIGLFAQEVRSIHPFYLENMAFIEHRLKGSWLTPFNDTLVFTSAGDNFFNLTIKNQDKVSEFEAAVFNLDKDQTATALLNLYPKRQNSITPFESSHFFKSNSLYKLNFKDSLLLICSLNFKWFKKAINSDSLTIEFTQTEKGVLLTTRSKRLTGFLEKNIKQNDFFGDPLVIRMFKHKMQQPHSETYNRDTISKNGEFFPGPESQNVRKVFECKPFFPNKDGWLGGDGAVSVALNDQRVLWFFSDTFVGEKDLLVRKGAKMISNSIALSECDVQKGWEIKYFWRNMYSDNPTDFFDSHTVRYRYWIQNVFHYKNNIYIALHKVVSNSDAYMTGTNDIGTTLAKISGYTNKSPDTWQIEYIPWSDVFQTNDWSAMFCRDDYLYIFTQPGEDFPFLTRLHMDHINEPLAHIEYWSKALKWKQGINQRDAFPILSDRITGAGGSLCYHEDLDKWLLIYGPGWYGKDIWIHTSENITGPWSKRKVLYEVPESKPGNAKFDKKNFCYFAREHCAFYDQQNQELLITYDCSLDNFEELVNSMDHYFPRTVRVPFVLENEIEQ